MKVLGKGKSVAGSNCKRLWVKVKIQNSKVK